MKRNYAYNYDFLEKWRVENQVTKEEMMTVMDAKSRNNLDEWLGVSKEQRNARKNGKEPKLKMLKLQHILALCCHYGIELTSFFTEDGKPYKIGKEAKKYTQNDTKQENEMLQLKVKHYEDVEKIRNAKNEEIERYGENLKKANDTITQQNSHIETMNQQAIEQQKMIASLQDTITQMQSTIASQRHTIDEQKRMLAARNGEHSEKGATESTNV